jgi:hypothetical protein
MPAATAFVVPALNPRWVLLKKIDVHLFFTFKLTAHEKVTMFKKLLIEECRCRGFHGRFFCTFRNLHTLLITFLDWHFELSAWTAIIWKLPRPGLTRISATGEKARRSGFGMLQSYIFLFVVRKWYIDAIEFEEKCHERKQRISRS